MTRFINVGIDGLDHMDMIAMTLPLYRLILVITLGFLSTGICISVFRRFKVNFIYIFSIDPTSRMNQYQFYKLFLFLSTILIVTALLELLSIKGYIYRFRQEDQILGYSAIMVCILTLILINPLNMMYQSFRYKLIFSLYQNIISPFGTVGFRDFVLGDILTSMVKPLIDSYVVGCLFFYDSWL